MTASGGVRVAALHVLVLLAWGCAASSDQSLLASEPARPESDRANHAALATTAEQAVEQWRHFRMRGTPPDLDFTVDAMLFLAGGESTGCPIEPSGLEIDHDAGSVVALVRPHEGECPSDDRPRTLVYRVRASALPASPFHAGIQGHRLLPVR